MQAQFLYPIDGLFSSHEDVNGLRSSFPRNGRLKWKGQGEFHEAISFVTDIVRHSDEDFKSISNRIKEVDFSHSSGILRTSANFDYDLYKAENLKAYDYLRSYDEDRLKAAINRSIVSAMRSNLNHLIFCMNIAFPECPELDTGVCIADDQFYSQSNPLSKSYFSLHNFCKAIKFPVLRTIPLDEIWKWYSKMPGAMHGVNTSKLGRAVVYFSMLFGSFRSQRFSKIVWAVAGIEALLAESQGGIERQIKERLSALVPSFYSTEIENHIKDMYDLRSRVLHGQVNITTSFNYSNGSEDDEYKNKEEKAERFAISVLLFLIQTLHIRKEEHFRFKTIILD